MKKFASLLLALVMCLCCLTTAALAERAPVAKDDLKIGFIFLHDENSTYDLHNVFPDVMDISFHRGHHDNAFLRSSVTEAFF